jgi:hypothetical protein
MRRVVTNNSKISAPIAQINTARNGNSETALAPRRARLPMIVLSAVSDQRSAISFWLSAISFLLSAIGLQLSVFIDLKGSDSHARIGAFELNNDH